MKVRLTEDYLPGTPGGGKAGDTIDLPAQTVGLLVGQNMVEPPSKDIIQQDALEQAIKTQLDPLMQKLNKTIEDIQKAQGKPPKEPGDPGDRAKFKSMGEFLCATYAAANGAGKDSRLQGAHGASFAFDDQGHIKLTAGHAGESEDDAGGFLVPTEQRTELMSLVTPQSIMRPRATVIPMRREILTVPVLYDRDRSSNLFGGVLCYWIGEGTTFTASRPTYTQIELRAKKLTGLTYASNELLADSAIGMEALLKSLFSRAIAYQEDESFFSGAGGLRPQGFMQSAALYTHARATASEVNLADLTGMYARMYAPSLDRAIWIAHPSVLPQLAQMTQNSGNSAPLVWLANGPVAGGGGSASATPPGTILGRPLIFSGFCPQLGTEGDLVFIDPTHYLVGDRESLRIDASSHAAFESDEIAWRFVQRVDGQVWLAGTILDRQSYECSPFVALTDAA